MTKFGLFDSITNSEIECMSITVGIHCMFLFFVNLSCHTIPVTTHVGCTIVALAMTCRQLEFHQEKSIFDWKDQTVCVNTFHLKRQMKSSWSSIGLHLPTWCWLWTAPNCLQCQCIHHAAMILKQALSQIFHLTSWTICRVMACRHSFWMPWDVYFFFIYGFDLGAMDHMKIQQLLSTSHHYLSVATLVELEMWCF